MKPKKIYLSPPHMTGAEMPFIERAFKENYIAPVGTNIIEFEKSIQSYLETDKDVVALNSGTAAIHLALIQAGVSAGDEVLCSNFSFVATANPILYVGATPVFIGVDSKSWNMDPGFLEDAIKDRIQNGKKPKAIIVAHSYGNPAPMDEIMEIASKHKIKVIEDAAPAMGSIYKGQQCGPIGDYGILSFNGNKIITTSGGGALITTKKKEALNLATHNKPKDYQGIGFNYRMSNVSAGIGLGQMQSLNSFVSKKRELFEFYQSQLAQFGTFQEELSGCSSNWWLTSILLDSSETKVEWQKKLTAHQIESRDLWSPLHSLVQFKGAKYFGNNIEKMLFEKGISLPSGVGLQKSHLDLINSSLVD